MVRIRESRKQVPGRTEPPRRAAAREYDRYRYKVRKAAIGEEVVNRPGTVYTKEEALRDALAHLAVNFNKEMYIFGIARCEILLCHMDAEVVVNDVLVCESHLDMVEQMRKNFSIDFIEKVMRGKRFWSKNG